MPNLDATRLRVFVPAKDYGLSKRFYSELGFTIAWEREELCEIRIGPNAFLLQNYYQKDWAENFMLYLNVDDVDGWWRHLRDSGVLRAYPDVRATPPRLQPWGDRVIHLFGPSGELWHLAETTGRAD